MSFKRGSCAVSQPNELSSHAECIPTANETTSTIFQKSPHAAEMITKLLKKTPEQAVYRQISLIPAYRHEDGIDDLDIDNLLGTPYTGEIAQAKKKREKKKRNKANKIAKKAVQEETEEGETFFTPISTAAATSPLLPVATEKQNVETTTEVEDDTDITVFMAAMSLGKPSPPTINNYDNISTPEYSNNGSGGHLKGIPTPTGSHIRFDDNDGNKVYLRGLPQPTGTHTTFKDE
jgi:hypothetical protein